MPFDSPPYPSQADFGNPASTHTHIDGTGLYVINGAQEIVLTPSSPFNPGVVAMEFHTGDAAESAPGLLYEIIDAGYWAAAPGGDSMRQTLFGSRFTGGSVAELELGGGSRDNVHGAYALLNAEPPAGVGNPASVLVDGDSMSVQIGQGLFPLNKTGLQGAVFVNCKPGFESLQVWWNSGASQLLAVDNSSGGGRLVSWDGTIFSVAGDLYVRPAAGQGVDGNADVHFNQGSLADKALTVRRFSSNAAAAHLTEWQTETGVVMAFVPADGRFVTRNSVEFGDGAAVQVQIWGTNGAPAGTLGGQGDFAFNFAGGAGSRIFFKNGPATWIGIV